MDENHENLTGFTEEEQARIARIDKLDSNSKNKKIILAGVTAALILIFVLGTVLGGKYILSYEGTQPLPAPQYDIALPTDDPAEFIVFLNCLIEDTKQYDRIKLDKRTSAGLDSGSFALSEKGLSDIAGFSLDDIEEALASAFETENVQGAYSTDFSAVLPVFDSSEYISKIDFSDYDVDSSAFTAFIHYDTAAAGSAAGLFGLEKKDDIIKKASEYYSSVFDITSASVEIKSLEADAQITRNALEDKLVSITAAAVYSMKMSIEFKGVYAPFGKTDVTFDYTVSSVYSFTRAGFSFKNKLIYAAKGDNGEFKYNIVSDESPADVKINLESSDESVVSIDKYGYYKAKTVSDTPVMITGTYTYNGVEYSDICEIIVRIPLEDVKLTQKTLELKPGDKAEITFKLEPADAGITKVYWFTEDENIAAVDENGVVTAVGAGETRVYLISEDGNYKRGCAVAVSAE